MVLERGASHISRQVHLERLACVRRNDVLPEVGLSASLKHLSPLTGPLHVAREVAESFLIRQLRPWIVVFCLL